ncbi:hypothetical protein C479_04522 [Halovivax asiaticus JCM 14624]|uniref:Exonuclease RecJ n=1 Tax=Halovivax asiaticus JCM 14624 TaxID=1227490 RepID=M0BP16_9EURY|nr:hypothetical protein [Halovivax asiaticus]ELZ12631.1 hypothetical protein C479_04522 [Halovivax asiaticus JCM 14624]
MTATGRTTEAQPAAIESAGFVTLLARPDGDALAAAGVLARALAARETPYQVSLGERSERATRVATDDDAVTVALGPLADENDPTDDGTDIGGNPDVRILDPEAGSLTGQAVALVDELDADTEGAADRDGTATAGPDPALALAGTIAAGHAEADAEAVATVVEIAREAGRLDRQPGVAIPTADPVDGLAHSTLVRAAWSGDEAAVAEAIGDANGRQLASIVAIDAVGHGQATERAATTIDRFVRPDGTPDGPLATAGGLADVLTATAHTSPAAAIALAIGHGGTDAALDAWRTHGEAVHAAIDGADAERHDGVYVLRLDEETPDLARTDAIESVAGLVAATSTPEPLVCVVGDDRLGLATTDEPVGPHTDDIADAHGLPWDAGHRTATIRLDVDTEATSENDERATDTDVDAIVETARGRP